MPDLNFQHDDVMLNRCLNSGRLQDKLLHVQRLSFIYLNCVTVEDEGKTKEITECKNHCQYLHHFLTHLQIPIEFKNLFLSRCVYILIYLYTVYRDKLRL